MWNCMVAMQVFQQIINCFYNTMTADKMIAVSKYSYGKNCIRLDWRWLHPLSPILSSDDLHFMNCNREVSLSLTNTSKWLLLFQKAVFWNLLLLVGWLTSSFCLVGDNTSFLFQIKYSHTFDALVLFCIHSFIRMNQASTLHLSNHTNAEHLFGVPFWSFYQAGQPQQVDCFIPTGNKRKCLS